MASSGSVSQSSKKHSVFPLTTIPYGDGATSGEEDDPYHDPVDIDDLCCPHCDRMTLFAASKGHLACLGYAIHNYPIHADACTAAAAGNFVDCMALLRMNNAQWTTETTSAAALHGSLETLRYTLDHYCSYDDNLLINAVEGGHIPTVQYLVDEVLLGMSIATFGVAFERADPDCVRALLDMGCPHHGYEYRNEDEWYMCHGYHTAPDVDRRFLDCISYAQGIGWSLNDSGVYECPNLVGYILRYANVFPLCMTHISNGDWWM